MGAGYVLRRLHAALAAGKNQDSYPLILGKPFGLPEGYDREQARQIMRERLLEVAKKVKAAVGREAELQPEWAASK